MPSEEFRAATNASACATPVWKRYYFVRRNPVIAAPDFPARWGAHDDLGGTFPDGLKRHPRTNYGVVTAMRGGTAVMQRDGIGLLWLGSPEWADRASSDPLHRPTMQQDGLRVFQQPVYDSAMLTKQRICKPGPLSKTALLCFIRREGVSDATFGAACGPWGAPRPTPLLRLGDPVRMGHCSACTLHRIRQRHGILVRYTRARDGGAGRRSVSRGGPQADGLFCGHTSPRRI